MVIVCLFSSSIHYLPPDASAGALDDTMKRPREIRELFLPAKRRPADTTVSRWTSAGALAPN
jgi:hypothetical protein